MAYVQVKNLLQTWKLAAFIVAFFSSFFSHSRDIDFSGLDGKPPQVVSKYDCYSTINGTNKVGSSTEPSGCASVLVARYPPDSIPSTGIGSVKNVKFTQMGGFGNLTAQGTYSLCYQENVAGSCIGWHDNQTISFGYAQASGTTKACPPDAFPSFTFGRDVDNDDELDTCYHPNDIQARINEQNELSKNDDYCKSLVLDSGNNTSSNACYSAYNGASCSVSQVTVGDSTYYKGIQNEPLGCGSSDDPAYDSSGTGDSKDSCLFSDGINYCEANRSKHCKNVGGTEICDDGCIDSGNAVFCDVTKHPDVGEGESDYFNDNGTCSVIAASSSKGFCKEMGGTWDETNDYSETSCPIGSGSCSTGASVCGACIDEGGVWTPDSNAQTDINAINDVAQRVEDSNIKLSAIENSTRKSGEAIVSTVSSGNGKIVAAIEELTKITKDKEPEKETFTTTTGNIDKSKINSLFDASSKTALEAEITQLKIDTTTFINSAKAEAISLMTITVPNSTGYEARNLTLTHGTFDMSLSRFDYFFKLLAGPVMLLCSVFAGFILLGGKG